MTATKVAFAIVVCSFVSSVAAATVRAKSTSQELLAALPGGAGLIEAYDASKYAADHLGDSSEVKFQTDGSPSYSEAMLAALPGGEATDLLVAADTSSSFLLARQGTQMHAAPFGPSVVVGALAGGIVGAVAGSFELGAVRCGATGALVGGVSGFLLELWNKPSEEAASAAAKEEDRGEVTELPEPALEKLHQLALTAVALSDYEQDMANDDGDKDEAKVEEEAEEHAVKALDDIVERMESSKKEPMNESEGDFEDIQEVLSEGDTAEFVTAESAAANNALVTANDLARMAGQNGTRVRGEDMGTAGDLTSFQGDMVPGTSKQLELFQTMAQGEDGAPGRRRSNAVTSAGATWTGAKVKYCFASDVSAHAKHVFLAACNQYSVAVPCMQFINVGWKKGSSTDPEHRQKCKESPAIFVQSNPREGCYSYVGMVDRIGKPSQRLQLQDPGCISIGTAIHELGHAIGMAHEQSRPDRNEFVKIHWLNIQYGNAHNFDIAKEAYVAEEYDLLSVMHYDRFAFARDPKKPTIEYVGRGVHDELGQRAGLSKYDVSQTAAVYAKESSSCKGNALAGMGCVNKPDDRGRDVCDVKKCNSVAARHCCGCGGGVQVQCYEGQDCPSSDPLPDLDASECIEDATPLFANAGYECIYQNVCKFNVEFKCPGFDCLHKARSKNYEAAQCNGKFQTKICRSKQECKVYKI